MAVAEKALAANLGCMVMVVGRTPVWRREEEEDRAVGLATRMHRAMDAIAAEYGVNWQRQAKGKSTAIAQQRTLG